jgi:hypothetical protein
LSKVEASIKSIFLVISITKTTEYSYFYILCSLQQKICLELSIVFHNFWIDWRKRTNQISVKIAISEKAIALRRHYISVKYATVWLLIMRRRRRIFSRMVLPNDQQDPWYNYSGEESRLELKIMTDVTFVWFFLW